MSPVTLRIATCRGGKWRLPSATTCNDNAQDDRAHLAVIETDHDPLGPDRPSEQALFVVERVHADESAARVVHHELVRRFEFSFGAGKEEMERERFAAESGVRVCQWRVACNEVRSCSRYVSSGESDLEHVPDMS